jgi:hypothetical protein
MSGIDHKLLAKTLTALATHTSDDVTRGVIQYLCISTPTRIDATDGHRLVRFEAPSPHGLDLGLYDPKQAIARLKADLSPVASLGTNHRDFPPVDQVIPAPRDEAGVPVLLNPAYLAEAARTLAAVTGALGVRIQGGEHPLDPVRLDAKGDHGSALAVIMPMRDVERRHKPVKPKPAPVETPAPVVVEQSAPVAETPAPSSQRGPRPGYTVPPKPCPVCGTMNTARRFSFLCEQHRTPEYLTAHKKVA